jgi:Fe2+ or Zn2+ uptake regulation protein
MSCDRDTRERLRAVGHRVTVQRLKVAAALRHRSGHHTAGDVRRQVAPSDPGTPMPPSTVYRALASLREGRLVAEVTAGGTSTYEWIVSDRHHHLRCRGCGGEQELASEIVAALEATIRTGSRFEPLLDHVVFAGHCERCQASEHAEGEPECR